MKGLAITGLVFVLVVLLSFAAYIGYSSRSSTQTTSSSSESTSTIQGIVTGFVTVGPSQPVCQGNQSCDVNLSGYSLEFTFVCSNSSCQTQTFLATLSSSGHYSILLLPGEYLASGLVPSCNWIGCASTFPQRVDVVGGSQLVLNFNVDTGIR